MSERKQIVALHDGSLGWLLFNNPERRNAVSNDMATSATDVLKNFSENPQVRVVILRGAGEKAFVSGGDISTFERRSSSAELVIQTAAIWDGLRTILRDMPKPTIAMVHGYCLGGGLGFALNCDIRICSDGARFGLPAAKLGIGYDVTRIRQLMDLVGPSMAKEMLYSARQYSAQEALRMGLVNEVVDGARLEEHVRCFALTIAENSSLEINNAKTAVNELVRTADSGSQANDSLQ